MKNIIIVGILLSLFLPLSIDVYAYNSTYDPKIDMTIREGLAEYSSLRSSECISVIATLDNICQVA